MRYDSSGFCGGVAWWDGREAESECGLAGAARSALSLHPLRERKVYLDGKDPAHNRIVRAGILSSMK